MALTSQITIRESDIKVKIFLHLRDTVYVDSQLLLKGRINLFDNHTYSFSIQIDNSELYEVNGTDPCSTDSLQPSPFSLEIAKWLELPIKFEYTDGKVGNIYCRDDEPEYVVNIKRGILHLLHLNLTQPVGTQEELQRDIIPKMYKKIDVSSLVTTNSWS